MAKFTVRVQLNGEADRSVYERLHASMQKRGFKQTIVGDDGSEFELPHGEYIFEADLPVQQVASTARETAETVWADVFVLVTEAARRSWLLKKIKQPSTAHA